MAAQFRQGSRLGESHAEFGAYVQGALYFYSGSMRLGDPAGYGKAQAYSAGVSLAGLIRSIETLENVLYFFRRNADPGVMDRENRFTVRRRKLYRNVTLDRGVLDGVVDQDQEHPPQRAGISHDGNGR